MESQIKSSFIPQDVGKEVRKSSPGAGGDLLVLGAIILLIASVSLAVAVFLYTQYLNTTIAGKQQSIDRARAAIEPALIEELARLDARMRSSGLLLSRHVAPSILFEALEQITLQSVVLTDLGLTTEAPDAIRLHIEGLARSVNSIALQSDLYSKSGLITSPIFSDINRDSNGLMHFEVKALINPNNFHYARLVEAASALQGSQFEQQVVPDTQGTEQPDAEGSVPSFTPTQ